MNGFARVSCGMFPTRALQADVKRSPVLTEIQNCAGWLCSKVGMGSLIATDFPITV